MLNNIGPMEWLVMAVIAFMLFVVPMVVVVVVLVVVHRKKTAPPPDRTGAHDEESRPR